MALEEITIRAEMKRGDTAGLRELAKAVKAFTADDSHKVFEEH